MIIAKRSINGVQHTPLRSALILCALIAATSGVLTGVIWAAGTAMAATTSVADAPAQVAATSPAGPLHSTALLTGAVLVLFSVLIAVAATRGQTRPAGRWS